MVNICMKCGFFNGDEYCERLGVRCKHNDRICEFYVKRRSNDEDCGD